MYYCIYENDIFALNLISTELGFDAILNFEMTINLPIREFLSENLMLLSFEAFNVNTPNVNAIYNNNQFSGHNTSTILISIVQLL